MLYFRKIICTTSPTSQVAVNLVDIFEGFVAEVCSWSNPTSFAWVREALQVKGYSKVPFPDPLTQASATKILYND